MSSWNDGYVTEIDYTHGYYAPLSPTLQRFAVLISGYAPPKNEGAYLELGFGQGLSACIHAAATPCTIWATDFNPSQALNAIHLMEASGIEANIFDQSFAELANRDDLPTFNYIGGHGIWTWISDANRDVVVDILQHRLAVGGLAYLSYNTLPGWSASLPLRQLLTLHAEVVGSSAQGVTGQVAAAMQFARQVQEKGAYYFTANPGAAARLSRMLGEDSHYLAHEYFNRDWQPMTFSDVARRLVRTKLDYIASVHLLDHVDELNLTPDARAMLQEISHIELKETLRDVFMNQTFRRDIYQRGRRRISTVEQRALLDMTRFTLQTPVEDIPLKIAGLTGEVSLQEAIYRPLLSALAKDAYRPRTMIELRNDLPGIPVSQLLQALMILIGMGHALPAQDEAAVHQVRTRTERLNRELCRRARVDNTAAFLASPETGTGIMVSRIEQLFLLARQEGSVSPVEWARAAWGHLEQQGHKLLKEGRKLESAEENLAELRVQANAFASKKLGLLQALGIA